MSAFDPKLTFAQMSHVQVKACELGRFPGPRSHLGEASRGEGRPALRALIGKRGMLSTIKCRARRPVAAGEW
jgi:hypothetical protein